MKQETRESKLKTRWKNGKFCLKNLDFFLPGYPGKNQFFLRTE